MRNEQLKAIAEGGQPALAKGAMRRNCVVAETSEPLRAAFDEGSPSISEATSRFEQRLRNENHSSRRGG